MKKAIVIFGILILIGSVMGDYGIIETWETGSVDIVVHVYDKQTGIDLTGATCTVDILNSTYSVLVNDATMTDSGNGWYNYTYTQNNPGVYYSRVKCVLGTNGSSVTTSFRLVENTIDDKVSDMYEAIIEGGIFSVQEKCDTFDILCILRKLIYIIIEVIK